MKTGDSVVEQIHVLLMMMVMLSVLMESLVRPVAFIVPGIVAILLLLMRKLVIVAV